MARKRRRVDGGRDHRSKKPGETLPEREIMIRLRCLDILCEISKDGFATRADLWEEDVDTNVLNSALGRLEQEYKMLMTYKAPKQPTRGPLKTKVIVLPPLLRRIKLLADRTQTETAGKRLVAYEALQIIQQLKLRPPIFIGPGGTGCILAEIIARSELPGLEVVTNALYLMPFLQHIRSFNVFGGELDRVQQVFRSPRILGAQLPELPVSFVGIEKWSWDRGCSCDQRDSEYLRAVSAKTTQLLVIMTDHTEWSKDPGTVFVRFQDLRENETPFRVICSALDAPAEARERLEKEQERFPEGTFVIVDEEPTPNSSGSDNL